MFVLSSPSGAGKTTLSRRLLEKQAREQSGARPSIVLSVSVTTRTMRPGEVDGKDYFFIDQNKYGQMVQDSALLEHARVFDHFYGTPKEYVERHLTQGIDVLFDIDWQGTRQLAQKSRDDLVSVFILPPTMGELERRLRARAQDSEEVVQKRMSKANAEISHWQEYDYVLVNDDLDATLAKIETILVVERMKRERQVWLGDFVRNLQG
jgi:guanylate kinase